MPEYLSKEEIRKWRSSLERITLEEYAARLGKIIESNKPSDDMVDKVMIRSLNSMSNSDYSTKINEIETITLKSFQKEKEISIKKENKQPVKKQVIEETKKQTISSKEKEKVKVRNEIKNLSQDDTVLTFKKALTNREQVIFEHFLANKNTIVYAKDLAKLLDLPRDYVYKYIKNLRSKLNENVLFNADNGGYLLKI